MKEQLTDSERIKKIIDYSGLSASKFAKAIGCANPDVLYHIQRGRNGISGDVVEKIVKFKPEINMPWILTGKGDMLKDKSAVAKSDKHPHISEGLPLIPFDFMAGYGEDNAAIMLKDCEYYKIPEFENNGAEFLIRVNGSSMYPKYSSGDMLACKKIHDILFFQWGKVYVIDSSQGQLIKRVFEHDDPDMILLVSDNSEKYKPFPIPKNDIRSLSIVVGVVRME
jgi:SOS-response transcriptional repressor LexA